MLISFVLHSVTNEWLDVKHYYYFRNGRYSADPGLTGAQSYSQSFRCRNENRRFCHYPSFAGYADENAYSWPLHHHQGSKSGDCLCAHYDALFSYSRPWIGIYVRKIRVPAMAGEADQRLPVL